jgi:hypothetical protein
MNGLEQHLQSQHGENAGMFWHRLRWRALRNRVPSAVALDLLDVGAGTGILGEMLLEHRPLVRYNFLEPVRAFEATMEQRWGVERNARDRQDLSAFAVVTLLDVIEHVPNDYEFCRDLLGRFAPSTRIIITVPALPYLWSGWDVALGHHRRYTRTSLARLLERLPLKVDEVSHLFPELVIPSLIRGRQKCSSHAEWPTFPPLIDDLLYALGVPSVLLRRLWPVGTSLLAVCQRT